MVRNAWARVLVVACLAMLIATGCNPILEFKRRFRNPGLSRAKIGCEHLHVQRLADAPDDRRRYKCLDCGEVFIEIRREGIDPGFPTVEPETEPEAPDVPDVVEPEPENRPQQRKEPRLET